MDFLTLYRKLIKSGYRAAFIRDKIAAHCGVKPRTVESWVNGVNVRECYLIALKEFKI